MSILCSHSYTLHCVFRLDEKRNCFAHWPFLWLFDTRNWSVRKWNIRSILPILMINKQCLFECNIEKWSDVKASCYQLGGLASIVWLHLRFRLDQTFQQQRNIIKNEHIRCIWSIHVLETALNFIFSCIWLMLMVAIIVNEMTLKR